MHFKPRKHRRAPSVIIVSLIDVLLVVLIFLMVTTTAKTREPALKLSLPESKQAKPGATAENKPFVVSVATNFPYFFVENRPLTIDQLQKDLPRELVHSRVRVEMLSLLKCHTTTFTVFPVCHVGLVRPWNSAIQIHHLGDGHES